MATGKQNVQKLPDEPTASPLYRQIEVTDSTTSVTKYLIAYRAVTIFPFQVHSEGNVDIPKDPHPGTVGLYLSERGLTAPNIEIHAEDIYFYLGSHFSFPGKTVTITANRIFAVPNHLSPSSDEVHIDCSGKDAPGPAALHLPGAHGTDATPIWHSHNEGSYFVFEPVGGVAVVPAQPGQRGDAGTNGGDGGEIHISGTLQFDPASVQKIKSSLVLNVAPGMGGRGQDGSKGGDGGSFFCQNYGDYLKDAYIYSLADAARTWKDFNTMPQVQGGAGGDGGPAGYSGKGGQVVAHLTHTDENFEPKFQKKDQLSKLQVFGGTGGQGGMRGRVWGDWTGTSWWLGKHGIPPPTMHQFGTISGATIEITDKIAAANGAYGAMTETDAGIRVRTDGDPGSLQDPVHLMMILQRMMFEYQMGFGSQPSSALTTVQTSGDADFKISLAWLDTTINSLPATGGPLVKQAKAVYQQLLRNMRSTIDHYGNPFNYVPTPNVALSEVKDDIAVLDRLQIQQQVVSDVINNINNARSDLKSKADDLYKDSTGYAKAVDDLIKQLNQQGPVVQELQDSVLKEKALLVEDLKKFWDSASHYFTGCSGWEGILGAVGSVMMFAQPEIGAAYAVGSVLSVASSATNIKTGLDPDDKNADPKKILRSISKIEQDVNDADVQAQIKTISDQTMVLKDPDSNLLTIIMTERAKFTDLCDRYFDDNKIPGINTTRQAFDALVTTIHTFKQALVVYNQLVLNYVKAKSDQAHAEANIDILALNNDQMSTDKFDLLYSYFTQAVAIQKAETLRSLYNGVRAYNCASMQPSSAFEVMGSLGSFDNIDSATLSVAYDTTLRRDLAKYLKSLDGIGTENGIGFSITETSHSLLFNRFKKERKITLLPLIRDRRNYGMEPAWFDIRMDDFAIYLLGAKDKRPAVGHVSHINVFVTFGGVFSVEDENGKEHDFQVPEKTCTFTYAYTDANSLDAMKKKSQAQTYNADFKFSMTAEDPLGHYSMPLRSPFIRWSISIGDDSEVDLTDLTEIVVLMDLKMRTKVGLRAAIDSADAADVPEAREGPRAPTVDDHAGPRNNLASMITPSAKSNQARPLPKASLAAAGLGRVFVTRGYALNLSSAVLDTMQRRNLSYRSNAAATAVNDFLLRLGVGRNVQPLSENVSKPWVGINPHYGDMTKEWLRFTPAQHKDVLTNSLSSMYQEMERHLKSSGGTPDSATFMKWDANKTGHFYVKGEFMKADPAHIKLLLDPKIAPIATFASFPSDVQKFMGRDTSIALGKSKDPIAFITSNHEKIVAEDEQIRRSVAQGGQDLTGHRVIVSSNGIVGLSNLYSMNDDLLTHTSVQATTTESHQLDGILIFCKTWHPDYPEHILYSNVSIGQSTKQFIDQGNIPLGSVVTGHISRVTPYALEALLDNKTTSQVLEENSREDLLGHHRLLNCMDDIGGWKMADLRNRYGKNTIYKGTYDLGDGKDITIEQLNKEDPGLPLLPDKLPGIFVDGQRLRPLHTMFREAEDIPPAGLTEEQVRAVSGIVDDMTKLSQSVEDIARLNQDLADVAAPYIDANKTNDDGTPRSTETIYKVLRTETAFVNEANDAIRKRLMSPDIIDSMADAISTHSSFSGLDPNAATTEFIRNAVATTAWTRAVEELSKPEGYTEIVTQARIDKVTLPELQTLDVAALIAAYTEKHKAAAASEEAMSKELESLKEGDERYEEVKRELDKVAEEKVRAEKDAEDAERTRDQVERADEREDEFRRSEGQEVDRVFGEGKGTGGAEGR